MHRRISAVVLTNTLPCLPKGNRLSVTGGETEDTGFDVRED